MKKTGSSHNIEVACCRCTGNICCEDFPNSLEGTKRQSLSLVKLKTSPAFLKMNSTTEIYSELSKIFRATISREDAQIFRRRLLFAAVIGFIFL